MSVLGMIIDIFFSGHLIGIEVLIYEFKTAYSKISFILHPAVYLFLLDVMSRARWLTAYGNGENGQ